MTSPEDFLPILKTVRGLADQIEQEVRAGKHDAIEAMTEDMIYWAQRFLENFSNHVRKPVDRDS